MRNTSALQAGTSLGEYVISDVLGRGGFGITYGARDTSLDAPVAIKEYFPDSLAYRVDGATVADRPDATPGGYDWGMEKFLNEATSLARLSHPNIVSINRLFRANNTAYMVLDYIDGPSLKEWLIDRRGAPTQEEIDQLLIPLLDALELIHDKGLMHRDIAPKNVMITSSFVPVLIDFGAARQQVAHHSQTFAAMFTPGYAPFEQYVATTKDQGPWTDIYALSATIYELMTSQLPPEAPERTMEDKCVPATQAAHGRYRPEFLSAIDWGLRPLPRDRPSSVADWRAAFAGTLAHVPVQ